VENVELTRSSGFPRLDRVALGIASEYLFQPATRHGLPVAACADFKILFKVI
jgi:outer membrane biosynthesis protein TonB